MATRWCASCSRWRASGTIAGCLVRTGVINREGRVRVIRDGTQIYDGRIGSLRRFKDDVKEVRQGFECGIGIENFNDLKVNDIIEAYRTEQVARTSRFDFELRHWQHMPHDTRRSDRVAEAIREAVATFLAEGVKDPRITGLVTVTGAQASRDLRHAKVFVSVLGSDVEQGRDPRRAAQPGWLPSAAPRPGTPAAPRPGDLVSAWTRASRMPRASSRCSAA